VLATEKLAIEMSKQTLSRMSEKNSERSFQLLSLYPRLRYTSNKVSKHLALSSEFLQEHQARYLTIAQIFDPLSLTLKPL
jgi:hypothetical protein